MTKITKTDNNITILNSDNKKVVFEENSQSVFLDDMNVSFPWEYEKWWILLEVKEEEKKLFYNFLIDSKRFVIVNDYFEITEKIIAFFGNIDVLIIKWTKDTSKLIENIDAKLVIPYWEWKDIFLNNLWQKIEKTDIFKVKWELNGEITEFVNLDYE